MGKGIVERNIRDKKRALRHGIPPDGNGDESCISGTFLLTAEEGGGGGGCRRFSYLITSC